MRYSWIIFWVGLMLFSCGNPKPRQPIMRTGSLDISESVALNRKLLEREEQIFKMLMEQDTIHTYTNSHHGFWYAYEVEKQEDSITPVKGDEVTFVYEIESVDGEIIYSQDELGKKKYSVDQEDFIQGIQEGIKLMKLHEKVIFLLPSLKAYSYRGDAKRIKSNTPLVIRVELLEIKK